MRGLRSPTVLLILLALLPHATLGAALAKAKAPAKKKAKKAATARVGGGGFGAVAAPPVATLQSPAWKQALADKGAKLQAAPNDPQLWLEMGAVLVKGREYAEAERIFRIGAATHPDFEMLSAAALMTGGDSEAYWHGEAEASSKPAKRSAAIAEKFESFEAPPDVVSAWDQADRAVDWAAEAKGGVVHRTKEPIISPEDCAWVIETAEADGGWTTGRHVQAPTTDMPVSQVPALREWFDGVLRDTLFPMMGELYPNVVGQGGNNLRVMDAFVVRYDAQGQASLPVHQDENVLSFTIALSSPDDYEGGGVCFEQLRPAGTTGAFAPHVLNADAGGIVAFPGKVRHGGNTITKGRRYIVPLFLYVDSNDSGKKPGYVQRQFDLPEAPPGAAAALSRYAGGAQA